MSKQVTHEMAKLLLEIQKYIGPQFPYYQDFNWKIDMCLKAYVAEAKVQQEV